MCFIPIDRDVMEVAKEVVATVTDPQAMVGPEVYITHEDLVEYVF